MPDTHRPARYVADLTRPEARLVSMLRHWRMGPEAQEQVWADLAAALGPPRARACLSAFETFAAHLARSAWLPPALNAPGAETLTDDEDAICRIVTAASEGQREDALLHASFLVRPETLLPLVHAAERTGLPLLCAECRARLTVCRRLSN
ncbi:hypothetical protein OCH239_06515 [Roseivivax halodurans JCM 10272]|uniref:Uncharacterized protein n=1 Tax=Roseivivax halodurans JCM 10272 TaxID=1449350 RepID=X7ED24_9RHOB|nr:hypothetical protein [Roseivivax halodurans]ETX13842.1 hypothetical protein OCH239_06515 [Roseivivax halodurans JCM 10272]